MTANAIKIIRDLDADEIAAHIAALAEEDRLLRVLLRAARAKERASKQAKDSRGKGTTSGK